MLHSFICNCMYTKKNYGINIFDFCSFEQVTFLLLNFDHVNIVEVCRVTTQLLYGLFLT